VALGFVHVGFSPTFTVYRLASSMSDHMPVV